jgi:hypothetical protein
MDPIEQRLRALEKRAQKDDERWHKLDADLKAIRLITESIGLPLCGLHPRMAAIIAKNLQIFETDAKVLNLNTSTISRLRTARKFFESSEGIRRQVICCSSWRLSIPRRNIPGGPQAQAPRASDPAVISRKSFNRNG